VAEPAITVDSAHPRHTNAFRPAPWFTGWRRAERIYDFADDLMTRNQVLLQSRQVALDDVEISPTDPASEDAKEDVAGPSFGPRDVAKLEEWLRRPSGGREDGGFHDGAAQVNALITASA
jgi:hypothetical protein